MRVVDVSQEETSTSIGVRVGIMALIFSVSLFSASFPSLTRRVRRLSIPAIVFFIGKHFGTGVILSTAFVHLLQDAFESLMDPRVRKQTQVGHWTGLIVLASLLLIFIVEYVSTAYVDRLHSYDSAPPSPKSKPIALPTPPTERSPLLIDCTPAVPESVPTSPRLPPPPHSATTAHVHIHTHADGHDANPFFSGHHRHETRASHSEHGRGNHPRLASYAPGEPPAACPHGPPSRMNSKSRIRSAPQSPALGRYNGHGQGMEPSPSPTASTAVGDRGEEEEEEEDDDDVYGVFGHAHHGHGHPHPHPHGSGGTEIGRKRQIVGILVLQLGIMLHSAVIGLTLSIASGADLTSLVTAIVFHQLFEGLSLGVRIAALPPSTPATLKTLLVTLFAVTTPTGIAIGLVILRKADTVSLLLTEGLLSAVSAGMLVYAATVEMLAADFVLDPALARAPVRRQALALASLAAGAAGMAVIGIVH